MKDILLTVQRIQLQQLFNSLQVSSSVGLKKRIMVKIYSSFSFSGHRALWLKVGSGSEHDVEMLGAAAGDAVTLPHAPGPALTPPPGNLSRGYYFIIIVITFTRQYTDTDLLEHLAGQVGAQQFGSPSNCLHRAGHSPQKDFSWQSASQDPCLK